MTILVTGATGHLGANLIRALLERGEKVRALIHRSRLGLDGLDVECVKGAIDDPESLRPAFEGVEVVYHLAAMISIVGDPDGQVHRTNVVGAQTVAQVARESGVRRMVHCSSVHAFDHTNAREIVESDPRVSENTHNVSAYDLSKARGEAAVREEIDKGLDAVVVHPSGVIGPNDFRPSRFGKALLSMARGRLPAVTAGGYDWVDVRDVASSMIAAAERGRTGQSYLLTNRYATLSEIGDRIGAITGKMKPLFALPLSLAKAVAPLGEAVARLLDAEPLFTEESLAVLDTQARFDNRLAREELGHDPRDLGSTLADTLRWFSDQGRL